MLHSSVDKYSDNEWLTKKYGCTLVNRNKYFSCYG
jgi:hypothetical protein